MLPIRTTIEDLITLCNYLAKKPTGATIAEAKAIIDSSVLDGKKMNAYKCWGIIEDQERLRLTALGREMAKDNGAHKSTACAQIIRSVAPYMAIVEKAYHGKLEYISSVDVATHWHDHFKEQSGSDSDKVLNDQAVCFFHVAMGADLGVMKTGRHGSPTRIEFTQAAILRFIESEIVETTTGAEPVKELTTSPQDEGVSEKQTPKASSGQLQLGQGIFLAHGKNDKPLEQLKKILDQFHIPYKVAVDEPNLGRPIGKKVREIMQACNCAILIFTADEEFFDKDGKSIWRPSENVVHELGAAGYLYDNRIVIMKEDNVEFPSNFRDIGHISFSNGDLSTKTMEVLKELIGFNIVKIST